jgi:hypothetical protein
VGFQIGGIAERYPQFESFLPFRHNSGESNKSAQTFLASSYEMWHTAENAKSDKKIREKGCLLPWFCGIINYVWEFAHFQRCQEDQYRAGSAKSGDVEASVRGSI